MKTIKSVLAMIVAICLMMCLAVPALATDTTGAATDTTAATDAATDPTEAHDHDHEDEISTDDIVYADGEEEPETGFVKVLRIILLVLEVISSVVLILVVLLQSGKEAGLSGALSGNSDSYLSKSGKGNLDKMLASATKWIALVWVLITLALALI